MLKEYLYSSRFVHFDFHGAKVFTTNNGGVAGFSVSLSNHIGVVVSRVRACAAFACAPALTFLAAARDLLTSCLRRCKYGVARWSLKTRSLTG